MPTSLLIGEIAVAPQGFVTELASESEVLDAIAEGRVIAHGELAQRLNAG